MAKRKRIVYLCDECGQEEPKWLGRCPACGAWNSFTQTESTGEAGGNGSGRAGGRAGGGGTGQSAKTVSLSGIAYEEIERRGSGFGELDRVLGGGVVPGVSVLIGGEPGIGKSTLLLQMAAAMKGGTVLYISGEESERQLRLRAERLEVDTGRVRVLCTGSLSRINAALPAESPDVVIVDSIQTLYAEDAGAVPGTVSQLRYCCYELVDWARAQEAALFLVAHVTKEGAIAGPKLIEHMVDAVLYFEQSGSDLRFLRATKNRFGPTDEVGLFSMGGQGLVQVTDPSSIFLVSREGALPPGVVAAPLFEGSRVLLVELQALTVPAKGGVSRIFSDRIDTGRVSRVAAVLEKHVGIRFSDQDIYVNVAGGMRVTEVGVELPLALALYSARTGLSIPSHLTVTGEVSLAGEVRPVSYLRRRIRAASELGFERCIGPKHLRSGEEVDVTWERVATVQDCIRAVFGAGRQGA